MNLNRLRDVREDKDMTQTEVAAHIHVSQSTYSKYESGKRNAPLEILIELTNYLDISLDYIAGITNDPTRHQTK